MINVNEIRISNYFQHDNAWSYRNEIPGDVFNFQWEASDWYALGECTLDLLYIKPIQLTPELLLKLGFKKDGYEDAVWYQKDFPFVGQLCTSDREDPLGNFLFDVDTDTLKIHYLHQLQNLYYSLTGNELEVEW